MRVVKPPNIPLSPYMYFTIDNREHVPARYSFVEITQILGNMWRDLEDKSKYEQMTKDARKIYDEEIITWNLYNTNKIYIIVLLYANFLNKDLIRHTFTFL